MITWLHIKNKSAQQVPRVNNHDQWNWCWSHITHKPVVINLVLYRLMFKSWSTDIATIVNCLLLQKVSKTLTICKGIIVQILQNLCPWSVTGPLSWYVDWTWPYRTMYNVHIEIQTLITFFQATWEKSKGTFKMQIINFLFMY